MHCRLSFILNIGASSLAENTTQPLDCSSTLGRCGRAKGMRCTSPTTWLSILISSLVVWWYPHIWRILVYLKARHFDTSLRFLNDARTSLVQGSVPLSHHVWREDTECSARFGPLTQFVVSRMTLKSLAKLLSKPWDLGVVPACSGTKHQLGIIIFKCDWKGKKWNHQPVGKKTSQKFNHNPSSCCVHMFSIIKLGGFPRTFTELDDGKKK